MRLRIKTKKGRKIEGKVVRRDDGTLEVTLSERTYVLKVARVPTGDYIIEDEGGKRYRISPVFSSKYERTFLVDGQVLSLENIQAGQAEEEDLNVVVLKSSFSGFVRKVFVRKHDRVRKGEPVVELESMKMINVLHSPIDGVVEEVYVSSGKGVLAGEKLLKIAKK